MQFTLATFTTLSEALLAFHRAANAGAAAAALASELTRLFPGATITVTPVATRRGGRSPRKAQCCVPVRSGDAIWQIMLETSGNFSREERLLAQLVAAHTAGTMPTRARPKPGLRRPAWRPRDFGLTRREGQVLRLIAKGNRDADIARLLGAAPRTVGKHVENIIRKLGVETRGAAVMAVEQRHPDHCFV